MATDNDTLSEIQRIVCEQLGVEVSQVKPDANFTEELGADSLDVVELVMAFEECFSIEIDDDSAAKIETVQDAVDYIDKAIKK